MLPIGRFGMSAPLQWPSGVTTILIAGSIQVFTSVQQCPKYTCKYMGIYNNSAKLKMIVYSL